MKRKVEMVLVALLLMSMSVDACSVCLKFKYGVCD